jgi:hypothetical protein
MSTPAQFAPVVQTTASGTGATTIIPASGNAAIYRDLVSLVITTANAAAATLTISDGTKTVFILDYPDAALAPGTPLQLEFCDVPIAQSKPNTSWTITPSVNGTNFHITAQYTER